MDMKNLEDIIRKNKDSFDVHDPSFTHFEQFKQKLGVNFRKKGNSFVILSIVSMAASLLLLLGFFMSNQVKVNINRKADLGDVSHEYHDVEVYYQTNYNSKLIEYQKIAQNKNTPDSIVLHELSNLNNEYTELQEDLANADNDNRVINAMISNYRLRIALLDRVINTLTNYTW